MADLLAIPFLACLVLTGIHAYLGLHVLARGVIFVDLALAQVAALGMTAGLLAGHAPQSDAAYGWALVFTGGGAALFALTRERRDVVPQEAIIGIVYAVAAALTVLVLDRVPQGSEYIKQLLVGSVLAVTADEVARIAALYAAIGAFHWLARRPMLALSSGGAPPRAALWDFVFYFTLGLVVTSSVRVAGVLLVFSYLIVPAVVGAWLARSLGRRLLVGWTVGVVVSTLGLALSYLADLPTGATIVATFGAVLALVGLGRGMFALAHRIRHEGFRALAGLAVATGIMVALAGLGLALFPRADHVWLDGLEGCAPVVQTAFLTPYERGVVDGSRAAIARGRAELERLRALQVDVQWGLRELDTDRRDRLRQFLAGQDELVAGDLLVLRTLRGKVRERQRLTLGIPLALGGATLASLALRWGRSSAGAPANRSMR
ncbi:MAG TPA: metal ABC transporter permease [Methylomirabilota bacterium]|jgi:zinc/manganese transport system permease protein